MTEEGEALGAWTHEVVLMLLIGLAASTLLAFGVGWWLGSRSGYDRACVDCMGAVDNVVRIDRVGKLKP